MWLHVPETPPQVGEEDVTLLSIHSGGGMLDEGVKAGLGYATRRRTCTVGYCERQAGAAATLVARMEDAGLDPAPVWDDSGSLPCELWRDRVAVVTAGIPCQPWSGAGARLGVRDPRWLWPHVRRALRDIRPGLLLLENVAGFITPTDLARDGFPGWLLPAGLAVILGDLAEMGWDAEWVCLPAAAVGAHHLRWRVFVGAVPQGEHALRARLGRAHPEARAGRRAPDAPGAARAYAQDADRRRSACSPDDGGRPSQAGGPRRPRPDAEGLRRRQAVGREPKAERPLAPDAARPDAESTERRSPDIRRRSESQGRDGEGEEAGGPRQRDAIGSDALRPGAPQRQGKRGDARQEFAALERDRDAGPRPVPVDDSRLPFFALPPQDCGSWQGSSLIEPAVEPGFCVSLHGMALVVDEARVTQLRTSGNGVVALQGACATVALVERLGMI